MNAYQVLGWHLVKPPIVWPVVVPDGNVEVGSYFYSVLVMVFGRATGQIMKQEKFHSSDIMKGAISYTDRICM
jgi:hypothetical protein